MSSIYNTFKGFLDRSKPDPFNGIKIGDVVVLKSGSLPLLVTHLDEDEPLVHYTYKTEDGFPHYGSLHPDMVLKREEWLLFHITRIQVMNFPDVQEGL